MRLIKALLAIVTGVSGIGHAPEGKAEFAVGASPPRFELEAKPGERLRQVLELTNVSATATSLGVRSADWAYHPDGTVVFEESLQPGSCRSWLAIERRDVVLAPRQTYRYRFEVLPPPDQRPGECRFALLLEGKEPAVAGGGAVPVGGRIGVIVYVAVGAVQPDLSVIGARVGVMNGQPTAEIQVRNTGTAHGRLDGFLKGKDAQGQVFDVAPASGPILPGESRWIALTASRPGVPEEVASPVFPLTVTGKLEWGKGRSVALEQRFDR